MFQFARSILLFGLLVSTLTAADENTLNDLKSDVEALEEEDIEDVGTKIERQLNAVCHKKADVIFVLDASTSISGSDFKQQLNFVRTVIRDLYIDPSTVRCGLVTYGDKIRVEFGLRTHSSAESAMKAVSLVSQLRGKTRTDLALRKMRQMMADDKRSGVPQIGIVITDGQSDNRTATRVEAEAAHQAGIIMFAVGVGKKVDDRELGSIASQKDFRFNVESFDGLETIRKILTTKACDVESHKDQTTKRATPKNDQTTKPATLQNDQTTKPSTPQNDQTTKPATPQNVEAACPFGFTYLPAAKSCYQVVYESHDWYSAGVRCQKLQDGAHTVAINSAEENEALKTFLAYQMPNHPACIPREHKTKGGFFWTSGQRRDESKCGFQKYNPFVWKLPGGRRQEFGFKNWRPLEPNCELFKEHCMVIWPAKSYGWNDERCSMKVCPLCEYNP